MYMYMQSLQSISLAAQLVHSMHRMKTFCFENKNIDPYRGTQQKDTLDRQTDKMSHPEHEINQSKFLKISYTAKISL